MANFEFIEKPPNASELATLLHFCEMDGQSLFFFKKFRLEMSTWYENEKKAYNFLRNILPYNEIANRVVKDQKTKDSGALKLVEKLVDLLDKRIDLADAKGVILKKKKDRKKLFHQI